ncbi:MAG TPA: endonuclease [Bacteroidales bacterium]|nr:endonuclease [Bacteroidales bacterium]
MGIYSIFGQKKAVASVGIMFYNVENLFDTEDDPEKNDNDFLPTSKHYWTIERYKKKLDNISKVILSVNVDMPVVVGLAEVENERVLDDLVKNTGLSKFNYKIIHKESDDPRGIDAALLYRPDLFKPLSSKFIKVIGKKGRGQLRTRDIVYTKGVLAKTDTVHIFINHWPSRLGGELKSEQKRMFAAAVMRVQVDSILKQNSRSSIVVVGDFNDDPDNMSIKNTLRARGKAEAVNKGDLVNLSAEWVGNINRIGTLKYKGKWNVFDQVIVSRFLADKTTGLCVSKAEIAALPFILQEDERHGGKKPLETYDGMKYTGGYSDHLPVLLKLQVH